MVILLKSMKRFLQFAAVVVVLVLASQPGLAGVACAMGMPASKPCAPGCDMARSQKAIDCPLQRQVRGTRCDGRCSGCGLQQGVIRTSQRVKSKISRTNLFAVVCNPDSPSRTAIAAPSPRAPVPLAQARYILFQVFRI